MWLYPTGCNPSRTVKKTSTAKVSSCSVCKMELCQKPQFGTTCVTCLGSSCRKFPSSTGGFHAKILALQDVEKAWKESEADFFSRSCGSVASWHQSSFSWKTYQLSLLEGGDEWLENLPRWGMIVGGVLYPLQALEHSTKEIDGFCWPTPTKVKKMMATPTASQAGKPIRKPKPSSRDGKHGEDLQDSIGRLNPELIGGKLSAKFVELMMGYQAGWTDLKPLETP